MASTPERPAPMLAGDRVELLGANGRKPACRSRGWFRTTTRSPGAERIARSRSGQRRRCRVRGLRAGREREGVEVPGLRRDLVADDRREVRRDAHAFGRRGQVGRQVVVVGGDRQLDPLAGQGDGPLVDRRVAVAAVGQGVDVRVAGDQALGRDLAADRAGPARARPPSARSTSPGVEPVLEPAGGGDRVAARRQADRGPAVGRVDDAGPGRQAGSRGDDERGQGPAVVDDRDPEGRPAWAPSVGRAYDQRRARAATARATTAATERGEAAVPTGGPPAVARGSLPLRRRR